MPLHVFLEMYSEHSTSNLSSHDHRQGIELDVVLFRVYSHGCLHLTYHARVHMSTNTEGAFAKQLTIFFKTA
jgi:hypothetical protein